jgi:tetratricopeptide (TPR) repeat protein
MNIKNVVKALLIGAATTFIAESAIAQDCKGFDAFPGGAEEGKKTHVLYRDLVNKQDYENAFPMWQKLMEHSAGGHVYHFIDGIAMYKAFAERDAADAAKVAEHVQKVVDLYEQRIKCFSAARKDEGSVLEMMAYDLSVLGYSDKQKVLGLFEKAVKMNGNATSAYILAYYGDYVIQMFGNELTNKDVAREVYFKLEAIKEANKDKADYVDNWNYVEQYYAPYIDYIFDCDYFLNKLKPQYEAAPDNAEVFRPILKTLLQKGCKEDNPFIAELIVKDKKLAESERAAQMADWMQNNPDLYANQKMQEGNVDEAMSYYEKAFATGNIPADRLAVANYNMGKIYHRKGQYGQARGYYNKAADLRGGWGEPYIEIGKMYASSVSSCASGDAFQMGVVVCAALDMWSKAKSVDGSVADEANSLIGKYSGSVVAKEEAFQRGVKAGQSASVGCWIGGSTTVRIR